MSTRRHALAAAGGQRANRPAARARNGCRSAGRESSGLGGKLRASRSWLSLVYKRLSGHERVFAVSPPAKRSYRPFMASRRVFLPAFSVSTQEWEHRDSFPL